MALFRDKKFPVVPYGCLYIDASWSDVLSAIPFSMEPSHHRSLMEYKLDRLWNRAHATPTPILPCLSVRTAFDLYLSVKKYPRGSEMVFCAINIPDMARIVRHHGVKIVALDVDIESLTPKVEQLEALITPKTVAILVAHVYGRWTNLEDIITVAKKHHLDILEDCAEAFCGVQDHGHPAADITFFSFGLIKTSTAFGGAIAVVRNPALLSQMRTLYHTYPIRSRSVFLKKLLKYSLVMTVLNSPFLVKQGTLLLNALGINHRELIVKCIRGFPKDFFANIRMRPSITLMCMLYRRLKNFDLDSFNLGNIKGDFVSERLPPGFQGVGLKAEKRNYWLFPVVVDDPERVMKELNARGVDAYRGATQLDLIESDVEIPRNLANPSKRVPQSVDGTSETADVSDAEMTMSSGRMSVCGGSGDKAGTVQSGFDHGRGMLQGQLKAEDVHGARTSPLPGSRIVSGKGDSDCDHERRLPHEQSLEKSSGNVDISIETGTARRMTSNPSLLNHKDTMQDVSLKHIHVERIKYVSDHSKEATEHSNCFPRSQSLSSNTSKMPSTSCMTSPSSQEPYRNSRIPSESQQPSHFGITSIGAGSRPFHCASESHCGTPGTPVTDDTKVLHSVAHNQLQHQHVHHESYAQSVSEGPSMEDSFLHSESTNNLDPSPDDLKSSPMSWAANNQRITMHSPNHPARTVDPSHVNHSSNTAVADATNTRREHRPTSFNTDSVDRGGSQAMPSQSMLEPSWTSPRRTSEHSPRKASGHSPSVMSGKYPNEARYLIEHVVYLPVHKKVSFHYLEQVCAVLESVASMLAKEKQVKVQSKL